MSESKNRKTKSISFDLTDEYEKGLLEHAEKTDKGKFSRYIKRLIAEDRDRNSVVRHDSLQVAPSVSSNDDSVVEVNTETNTKTTGSSNDDSKSMGSFL